MSRFIALLVLVLGLCLSTYVECASQPLFKVFTQATPIYRGRADPIVSPGEISQHSHKVFGASKFSYGGGKTIEQLYDEIMTSDCTTSSITVDKSLYWIPDLYYQWPNGTFTLVPVGGMTVYYFGRTGSGAQANPDYKAFPRGFRMIAGNPFKRSYAGTVPEQGISYACLSNPGGPETPGFPTATRLCVNGLRAQVFFPQCWNGQLDSPNHRDHVAYPDQYNTGNCPSTHPLRIPAVFYEVLFSVDNRTFPHGYGVNPFVWAMGDSTGYGLHGDFLNGWDVPILQAAMKDVSCFANNTNNGNTPENCNPLRPYVKASNPDQSCLIQAPLPNYEDLGMYHTISHLPGNNNVTSGPDTVVPAYGSYAQQINPGVMRVLLRSARNGLYVTALAMSRPLTASVATNLTYSEVFVFIPVGPAGEFGIMAETTIHWVSSNNGGASGIAADRNDPSGWEFWTVQFIGGTGPSLAGTLGTLKASNGRFVGVQANGLLVANSQTVSVNEQFYFVDANAGVPDTRRSTP